MFETATTMLEEGRVAAYERATALARTQRLRGADHSRAALVQETDRVFKKAALDALQLRELWLAVWSTVENLNDAELAQVGEVLRALFAKWQAVLADMERDVQDLRGQVLASAPLVHAAAAELSALQQALAQNWPWQKRPMPSIDPAMMQKSRAATAQGACDVFEVKQ